ncbi:unnamed protein product [Fraxinus pennsylvanica]|uniref:S-locus receptor kinase C-terminal domain-containing protein n=1 Tax=Fraxinus pennsylvanica TaxID=56036 RepID=A0AAD2A7F0_9LAMI|nr:unnamed protein product [Fraxinus pennsylvanica]
MASSELGSSGLKRKILRACLASLGVVLLLCLIFISFTWKKKKNREKQQQVQQQQQLTREGSLGSRSRQFYTVENDNVDLDLPLFDVNTILNATNYFSPGNKIGEGGFGPVYKGVLKEGKEIAVKRLSNFGVLVLETISGQKNRGFIHLDHHHNLLGHAWILHNEGRSLELIDSQLAQSCYLSEVLRSMHIALLCVQRNPEDRPSMSNVVLMLSSEGALPKPKEPGFFTERNLFHEAETSSSKPIVSSGNELSFTVMEGR